MVGWALQAWGRSQLAAATAAACDRRACRMMSISPWCSCFHSACVKFLFFDSCFFLQDMSFFQLSLSLRVLLDPYHHIMFRRSKSSYFKMRNPWKSFPYPIPNSIQHPTPPRPTARCATWSDPVPGPWEVTDCSLCLIFWKTKSFFQFYGFGNVIHWAGVQVIMGLAIDEIEWLTRDSKQCWALHGLCDSPWVPWLLAALPW